MSGSLEFCEQIVEETNSNIWADRAEIEGRFPKDFLLIFIFYFISFLGGRREGWK